MFHSLRHCSVAELFNRCPAVSDFFSAHGIDANAQMTVSLNELINANTSTGDGTVDHSADVRVPLSSPDARDGFVQSLAAFMEQMQLLHTAGSADIASVTVLPGRNKLGDTEPFGVTLCQGEVTAVVGPTGAGKSRLLEDLECLAQKDTPTQRQILVNNEVPGEETRFGAEGIVAQLSQNMNFVMDLSVMEFLTMHAESRLVPNVTDIVEQIFTTANELSGETFRADTAVTQLSGGQSRALMIADTALLSAAPIILIDEIENAGVDKIKALALLIRSNKIVLLSTHDPLLALSAHRRVVIRNGGIHRILTTSEKEQKNVATLQRLDRTVADIRQKLRNGEEIAAVPGFEKV